MFVNCFGSRNRKKLFFLFFISSSFVSVSARPKNHFAKAPHRPPQAESFFQTWKSRFVERTKTSFRRRLRENMNALSSAMKNIYYFHYYYRFLHDILYFAKNWFSLKQLFRTGGTWKLSKGTQDSKSYSLLSKIYF